MTSAEVQDVRRDQYPEDWPSDLTLADFTATEPEFLQKPNPYYRLLRENEPVFYDEKLNLYLVSRYEDIQTVLRDAITFSQELGWKQQFARGYFEELKAILERDGGGYFPEILLLDPPAHTRMRKLMDNAFSPRRIRDLEPRLRRVITDRIESMADRGSIDGVTEFAVPLTISIICEQLGFPPGAGADRIPLWSRAYTAQTGGIQNHEQMLASAKLICELQHFIIDAIAERKLRRREDMISDLIYARLEDDEDAQVTFEETVALTRGLLNAGNDTTARGISNFLYLISTRPDAAEQLYQTIDDDGYIGRFIEELLRFSPPVRGLFRVTTKEVEVGGTNLPKGAHLMIMFASGNDDPGVFECPRLFDPTRKNVIRHLSFGGGIHLCAGIALARMELRIIVREIMTRLKDIRLAMPADQITYLPSLTSQTIESLPLTFSRRE